MSMKARRGVRGTRMQMRVRTAATFGVGGLVASACEAPPPAASYTTLTYRVATGGVIFPTASNYWVDPARPEVSFDIGPSLGWGATLVEDHVELGHESASGWSLNGGSVVAQVRNSPDGLHHDHPVVVLTTVLHHDDDAEELAESFVVPADSYMADSFMADSFMADSFMADSYMADSYMAGYFNDATLVK
jgi:hypothetical protein